METVRRKAGEREVASMAKRESVTVVLSGERVIGGELRQPGFVLGEVALRAHVKPQDLDKAILRNKARVRFEPDQKPAAEEPAEPVGAKAK